jgi:hypothetical protein
MSVEAIFLVSSVICMIILYGCCYERDIINNNYCCKKKNNLPLIPTPPITPCNSPTLQCV